MNLNKLFKTQAELDKRIVEEKGLQGQDLLDKKILALQVELGELANEWRGFKFWSENLKPKDAIYQTTNGDNFDYFFCAHCSQKINKEETDLYTPDEYCGRCDMELHRMKYKNPLLEEYVDCLHFILSIGLELNINENDIRIENDLTGETTTETFNELFTYVSSLRFLLHESIPATVTKSDVIECFHEAFECFVGLGEKHLGFTWEQIEQAYFEKNKINHERQANGY